MILQKIPVKNISEGNYIIKVETDKSPINTVIIYRPTNKKGNPNFLNF